jgi:hypothetical protein
MPDSFITRGEFEHYKEKDLDRQDRMRAELGAKLDDLKDYITAEFKELRDDLANRYATKEDLGELKKETVTHHQFEPIKRLVYGAVGIILAAVVSGIIALVLL